MEIGVLPTFGGVRWGARTSGGSTSPAGWVQLGEAPTNDLISSRSYLVLQPTYSRIAIRQTRPIYSDFCEDELLLPPSERSTAIGSIQRKATSHYGTSLTFRDPIMKVTRLASRNLRAIALARSSPSRSLSLPIRVLARPLGTVTKPRLVSSATDRKKGIMPGAGDPKPTEPAKTIVNLTPITLTEGEYHDLANEYLDNIVTNFDRLQSERDWEDIEYEVRTLAAPF